jgi:hypothetical protein
MLVMLFLLMTVCTLRVASEVLAYQGYAQWVECPANFCADRAYCDGVVCSQLDRYVRPTPGGYDISADDDDRVAIREAEMNEADGFSAPHMVEVSQSVESFMDYRASRSPLGRNWPVRRGLPLATNQPV